MGRRSLRRCRCLQISSRCRRGATLAPVRQGPLREPGRKAYGARSRTTAAAEAGDFDTAVVWNGEEADLVRRVEPAAAILEALVGEAEKALSRRFAASEAPY